MLSNPSICSSMRYIFDKLNDNIFLISSRSLDLNFLNLEWIFPSISDQLNLDES